MFLFYAPVIENGQCFLSPSESHHCAKVLRLKAGEEIWITDGRGSMFESQLLLVDDKQSVARVGKVLKEPELNGNSRPRIHIVMAPTKNIDRTEWFIEKAAEVGLGAVSFVRTEHSERKVIKPERMEAILISAMKQSQQAYLPWMNGFCTLKEYIHSRFTPGESIYEGLKALVVDSKVPSSENRAGVECTGKEYMDPFPQKFIAYCGEEYPKQSYISLLQPGKGAEVLIGPEGDFSPAEVKLCVEKGYVPVSLGNTRLRTETAALYAAWAPAMILE